MSGGTTSKPEDGKKKARIEIIPLIDVIFFLLATFVLFTLSLNKIQSVPVQLPVPDISKTPPDPDMVTLQVTDGGTYFWNREPISAADIAPGCIRSSPRSRLRAFSWRATAAPTSVPPSLRSTRSARPASSRFQSRRACATQANNRPMRRDLFIGFIASFAIHFGVAYFGSIKSPPPPKPPAEVENVIKIKMPPIEPDEPEVVEDQQQQQPVDIAPPMQNDVPQQVSVDSFVQPIEPPPPDITAVSKSVVKIPETRTGFGKGIEVFDISKLDQAPSPRFQARPSYPFEMRRQGISGEVLVDFIVDTNGDVRNASAVHSTQREFEANAVQAVSRWKFRPGRKNGHAVYTHMQVPIVFTLADNN